MGTNSMTCAVGIDLGTTHCALAWKLPGDAAPEPFLISQVIAPGEVSARPLLPSFLYAPAEGELASGALSLPFLSEEPPSSVGEFARSKGATTPARLVSSAKSWLCHAGVDRKSGILPWGAPEGVPKISPVAASAEYLRHMRLAWDAAHPEAPLSDQEVVLTIPASFDAVARELTLEAAEQAGFAQTPRLLEEPQAALYDWVAQSAGAWRDEVKVGERILVVDVGGGTTDFSLIAVAENEGSLELARVAVGNHILLGGDNMDLALAYTVRAKLEAEGKKLDDWQMQALTHGCRAAKEALLAEEPPESVPLVIPGRSSRLIGGTLRTQLSFEQLKSVVLDGFLPLVGAEARPQAARRVGLQTLGLPYASDAGITRHLAEFLGRSVGSEEGGTAPFPTAVLFNGGVMCSPVVKERVLSLLGEWAKAAGQTAPVALSGTDAELAVSRGAAYFAQACRDGGLKIRSGTAQSHYIGIERAELAVPGIPPRVDAVCVAPFGMEDGAEVQLEQSFGLVLGEPVSFRFLASTERQSDAVGQVVEPSELVELSPLETTMEGPPGEVVEVRLQARVTEVGTLEIAAAEVKSERRWKLSFNIRVE